MGAGCTERVVCVVRSCWRERLWRVPVTKKFMWPTFEVGHRVNVLLAPKLSVELETLAKSPRLFRVRGFLSSSEVTALTETMLNNKTLTRSTTFTGTVSRDRESYGDVNRLRTSDNAWDEDSSVSLELQRRAMQSGLSAGWSIWWRLV